MFNRLQEFSWTIHVHTHSTTAVLCTDDTYRLQLYELSKDAVLDTYVLYCNDDAMSCRKASETPSGRRHAGLPHEEAAAIRLSGHVPAQKARPRTRTCGGHPAWTSCKRSTACVSTCAPSTPTLRRAPPSVERSLAAPGGEASDAHE